MEATTTLRTEHNALLYVLDQLEHAAAAAAAGRAVPRDVFSDIEEVFCVFVDRCHHAKEETVLFPLLAATGLPQTLEAELPAISVKLPAPVKAGVPPIGQSTNAMPIANATAPTPNGMKMAKNGRINP